MRARLVLSAGLVAGALLASAAGAAPAAPQITDPKGDAVGAQGALDIVSVTFGTTKTSASKTAPVKEFVVTMELAAAPDFKPGTAYTVRSEETPCGGLILYAYWTVSTQKPRAGGFFNNCGPSTATSDAAYLEPKLVTDGNKVSWVIAGAMTPKEIRSATLGGLRADTALAEPLAGISTELLVNDLGGPAGSGAVDFAQSDKKYKYGS